MVRRPALHLVIRFHRGTLLDGAVSLPCAMKPGLRRASLLQQPTNGRLYLQGRRVLCGWHGDTLVGTPRKNPALCRVFSYPGAVCPGVDAYKKPRRLPGFLLNRWHDQQS